MTAAFRGHVQPPNWEACAGPGPPPPDNPEKTEAVAAQIAVRIEAMLSTAPVSDAGELWPSKTTLARRLHPPRRRVRSLPAGIIRAAGAGWERSLTTNKPANEAAGFGAVDPQDRRGSLPAGLSAQGRRVRFGSMRANRSAANGLRKRSRMGCTNRAANKGGCVLHSYESGPESGPAGPMSFEEPSWENGGRGSGSGRGC